MPSAGTLFAIKQFLVIYQVNYGASMIFRIARRTEAATVVGNVI